MMPSTVHSTLMSYHLQELGADKNHNSQQRPTDAYHRGSCPPVVPVKLRYNQDSNSSRLERFSQPTTVQSNGQSVAKGRRSVHGVVESIIRQVQSHVPFGLHEGQTGQTIRHSEGSEHSRSVQHDSNDNFTPYHLQAAQSELSPTGEDFLPEVSDAFTQTSPVSLSRSSSFTWLSDLEVYEDSDQRQSFLLDQMDNYRSEAHLQMRQIYETDRPNSAHSSTLVDLADQPEDISDSSSTDEGEMSREHDGPDTQELSRSYENDSQLLSELSGVASSEEEEFSLSRISGRDYVAQYSGEPSVPKFAQHPDAQLIVATGKYAIIGLSKAQRDGIRLQQPSTTLPSSSEIWTGDDTELAAQQQSRLTSASLSAGHRNSIKESPTAPSESEKSNSDNFQLNRRSIPPSLTINDSTAAWKTGEKAVPHGQIPRMGMINTERRGKFESNRLGGPHLALQGDNSGNGSGKDMISGGRRLGVEERVQVQEATKAGWTDNCLHSQEEQKSNNESSDLSLSSARDFLCFNNSSPSSSGTETENIAQAAGGAVPTGNSQPFQQQRQTLSVSGPRMEFAELRRKSLELTLSHAYPSSSPSHRCSADHTGLSTELSVKGRQALQEAHSVLMSITKAEREWLSASPESNGTLTSAESPFENISVTSTPITPAEGFNTRGPMPRDVSLASGILGEFLLGKQ